MLSSSWLRVEVALSDPGFDRTDPVGMMKSDPALLFYITERILESDGHLPDDARADPRVEHPHGADLPAQFTLGQEFLVAWTYPWLARGAPLHVFAQRLMAFTSSLVFVGVFLFVAACTGRPGWALFAALLAALLPANYRTIGFVLVREDLSLPLFALHAGLAAWATRATRWGTAAAALAGVMLALALATWHAMTFVFALEVGALALLAICWDQNPLATRRGWLVLAPVATAGVLVPALAANGLLTSLPMLLALALGALAWTASRRPLGPAARTAVLVGTTGALWLIVFAAASAGWGHGGELSHVYEVVLAKLRHLGQPPADPRGVPFDARLLWQGPFQTLSLGWGMRLLAFSVPVGLFGIVAVLTRAGGRTHSDAAGGTAESHPSPAPPARARGDAAATALALFTLLSLPAAWMIARTVVLPGLALPTLAALALARRPTRPAAAIAGVALAAQALVFVPFLSSHELSWYKPPGKAEELQALLTKLPDLVPPDEPICSDFVNSTSILAHTRHPIVLQPKYETDRSRRDAEAFLTTFFEGTPADLATLLRERFRCRYLLVDRYELGYVSPWVAGVPAGRAPQEGSCAAILLSQDREVLEGVPELELVYRSPTTILQSNGRPYDLFRVYRVRE
ncbi:MAG: hypothetical protein AAF682_31360 [Planctomycetota bacterium]